MPKQRWSRKYHLYEGPDSIIAAPGITDIREAFFRTLCPRGDSGNKAPWPIVVGVKVFNVLKESGKDLSYVCGLCQLEAEKRGLTESDGINLEESQIAKVFDWPTQAEEVRT